jgi:hypothetical protein
MLEEAKEVILKWLRAQFVKDAPKEVIEPLMAEAAEFSVEDLTALKMRLILESLVFIEVNDEG